MLCLQSRLGFKFLSVKNPESHYYSHECFTLKEGFVTVCYFILEISVCFDAPHSSRFYIVPRTNPNKMVLCLLFLETCHPFNFARFDCFRRTEGSQAKIFIAWKLSSVKSNKNLPSFCLNWISQWNTNFSNAGPFLPTVHCLEEGRER